jgi:hypothetical protein
MVDVANNDLPRTLEELNAWYIEPAPGENAATFYLQGLNALRLTSGGSLPLVGKGTLPALSAPIPLPLKSALATLVRSNEEALNFFDRGVEHDQSRYPVNLALGYDPVFPTSPNSSPRPWCWSCPRYCTRKPAMEPGPPTTFWCRWRWDARWRQNLRCSRN